MIYIYGILKLGGDDGMSADGLEQFESDLDEFGPRIQTWDMEQPTKSVDFLDLTEQSRLTTEKYRLALSARNAIYINTTYHHYPNHPRAREVLLKAGLGHEHNTLLNE
jgi:hypothetical protein